MTVRPGYISDGNNNWIQIGPAVPVGSTVYYQASEPSSPQTGDIWIDADNDVPSIDNSQFLRWRETAVGGETSLSGNDDNGLSLQYTPGYEQVYINGVLQVRGQDYTATTGTSITGLTALAANDVVEVFSVVARLVGDVYTQSQSDNKYSPITTTGLVLLNTTTFTAASSVSIDNVFSSSYTNYKVLITISTATSSDVAIRWYGRSGSPAADVTTDYTYQLIRAYGTSFQGATASTPDIGNASLATTNHTNIDLNIYNPNTATATQLRSIGTWVATGGVRYINDFMVTHTGTNQFTGMTIFPTSGTFTGTIRTYGIK